VTAARAVVFDFDGVLADTEGLHLASYQEVFAPRGWTLDRDTYNRYLGNTDHDLIQGVTRERGLRLSPADVDTLIAEKTVVYLCRVAAGDVLFGDACPAIARLGLHYRLAIASGSFRKEILAILTANNLTAAIAAVVGADDVARSKPAPDSYLAAVDALGVRPSHAVAIEDSIWGLTAARAAGLHTIGITTSHPASLLTLADTIVNNLDEVTADLIDRMIVSAGGR